MDPWGRGSKPEREVEMNHLYLRQPAATGREPGSTIPRGIYQSTSLPVYQSTSLPVYQSTSLPVYQS